MNQLFEQMKASLAPAIPATATPEQFAKAQELLGKIVDLLKSRMNWETTRPAYVKTYSETFSGQEINGMLAFYESPVGRAMLAKMPVLTSKIMAQAQAVASELMPEIQRMVKEWQAKNAGQ